MIITGTPEEIRALVNHSTERKPVLIRAQESGVCVYYDPDQRDHCTYPYDRACPHLDDPEILCPVKDGCSAMRATALLREACEAEQEGGQCVYYDERSEHEDDVEPCTYPYEWECPHLDDNAILCPVKDELSAESERIEQDLAWAWGDDLPEFVSLTQDPYGDRDMAAEVADQVPRSDYVLAPRDPQTSGGDAEESEPEFPAPTPDEEHTYTTTPSRGGWLLAENDLLRRAESAAASVPLYREEYPESARTDGAIKARWYYLRKQSPAPAAVEGSEIAPGDQVILATAPEQVGTVRYVNGKKTYASVEFGDAESGPAHVYAIKDLRRVIA